MIEQKKYILHFLYFGWEEMVESNNLKELAEKAKDLITKNSGKPLIIKNRKDEIVREYTPRLFNFNEQNYSDDFKTYRESMAEIKMELEEQEWNN